MAIVHWLLWLNKTCPKDFYYLPNIDQLIEATAGHELLSFMDTFSGYNQIKMDSQDWKKNSIHHTQRSFWLSKHVVRPNQRRSHIPTDDGLHLRLTNWEECSSLRRWHDYKFEVSRRPCIRPSWDVRKCLTTPHAVTPRQMLIWSDIGKVFRVFDHLAGYRDRS